ncbi:MAG: hypothetical protein HN909_05045 [Phycisphaerales bacterium]|nr:hypothetical protein [Phycisphaerales bacterium]MBT7171118.1 hypothetical protein [Phycisphaerales bacterium]
MDGEFLVAPVADNQIPDLKTLSAFVIEPPADAELPVAKVLPPIESELRMTALRARAYRLQIAFGSALGVAVILILMSLIRRPLQNAEGGLFTTILTVISIAAVGFLLWTLWVLLTLRGGQFSRLPRRARWQGLFAVVLLLTALGSAIGMGYLPARKPLSPVDTHRLELVKTVVGQLRAGEVNALYSMIEFEQLRLNTDDFGATYRAHTFAEGKTMIADFVASFRKAIPKGRLVFRVVSHGDTSGAVGVYTPVSRKPIFKLTISEQMVVAIDFPALAVSPQSP